MGIFGVFGDPLAVLGVRFGFIGVNKGPLGFGIIKGAVHRVIKIRY